MHSLAAVYHMLSSMQCRFVQSLVARRLHFVSASIDVRGQDCGGRPTRVAHIDNLDLIARCSGHEYTVLHGALSANAAGTRLFDEFLKFRIRMQRISIHQQLFDDPLDPPNPAAKLRDFIVRN